MQHSQSSGLVVSTPKSATSYSAHDVAAVATTIDKIPHSLQYPWTGPFRLLDLDWHARRAFLEVLIGKSTVAVFLPGRYGQQAIGIKLPIITRVNKQLRTESLLVAIEETTFEIHSGPGNTKFQNWLTKVDFTPLHGDVPDNIKNGFDAVQKLRFPFFSRFPHHLPHITSNNDITFMKKCDNLREVTLNFHVHEVFQYDVIGAIEKSAEQLIEEYYLAGLLDLNKLTKLSFEGWCSANEKAGIIALAKWFEAEFKGQKKKGIRKDSVEVTWPGKLLADEDDQN